MSHPSQSLLVVAPMQIGDLPLIETMLDEAFGLERRIKTSYRLREGSKPVCGLSLVVRTAHGGLAGAISFWPLAIGEAGTAALLLGPLVVGRPWQNQGIGQALMKEGLRLAAQAGHKLVILVGDAPYYARVGFAQVPEGQLLLPGPVNPARLLYLELTEGALQAAQGLVVAAYRHNQVNDPHDTTLFPR